MTRRKMVREGIGLYTIKPQTTFEITIECCSEIIISLCRFNINRKVLCYKVATYTQVFIVLGKMVKGSQWLSSFLAPLSLSPTVYFLPLLYILTRICVLHTPNTDQNLLFPCSFYVLASFLLFLHYNIEKTYRKKREFNVWSVHDPNAVPNLQHPMLFFLSPLLGLMPYNGYSIHLPFGVFLIAAFCCKILKSSVQLNFFPLVKCC